MKLKLLIVSLFACSVANAQYLQGEMESWRTITTGFPQNTTEAPNGWFGSDSLLYNVGIILGGTNLKQQMFKDGDAHTGSFAAKVITIDQGASIGKLPGTLVNAKIGFNMSGFDPNNPQNSITYSGGLPVNAKIENVKAWIKYMPKGSDNARMVASAVLAGQGANGQDSVVGVADTTFSTAINNYTLIDLTLDYPNNVTPDKLLVLFVSSRNGSTAEDSSMMLIDDVSASYFSTGIEVPLFTEDVVSVYPNPAKDVIRLDALSTNASYTWQLMSVSGQKLISQKVEGANVTVDISTLSAGVYFYNITDTDGTLLQKGKISVLK